MALNKPIDLDKVGKVRGGRVVKVGLELEGGWDADQIQKEMRIVGDGSVQFPELHLAPPYAKGELNSHPMPQSEVESWMKQFYPRHINKTCGLHIHMSTKYAFYYQMLMDISYPSTILKYMRKWSEDNKLDKDHPIWPRLDGKSIYCQHIFSADDQVIADRKDHDQNRKGHRYTVINYCHKRYSTVECRLLPMMATAELSISAIKEVVGITEKFLVATAAKEAKLKESISVIERPEEEHSLIEVVRQPERGWAHIPV